MISCTYENGNQTSLRHVVADVLVLRGDQVLLVKRAETLLEGGKWALVGGFIERDERVAEGITREILEETGWRITNLKLFKIIDDPNRPNEDRQNVSFVFLAEALEQVGQSDWEVDQVKWFPLDGLPKREQIAFDHYQNIQDYLEYKKQKFSLPMF